ncbi:MAG: hypothetical protein WDW38_010847 [Sanguina aurantia]
MVLTTEAMNRIKNCEPLMRVIKSLKESNLEFITVDSRTMVTDHPLAAIRTAGWVCLRGSVDGGLGLGCQGDRARLTVKASRVWAAILHVWLTRADPLRAPEAKKGFFGGRSAKDKGGKGTRKKRADDGTTYALNRFSPLMQDILEDMVAGRLSAEEFPYVSSEMRVVHALSRSLGRDIILGSTSIETPTSFTDMLYKIGSLDE